MAHFTLIVVISLIFIGFIFIYFLIQKYFYLDTTSSINKNINVNVEKNEKNKNQKQTTETMLNPVDSFCEYYSSDPPTLKTEAAKLTQKNCSNTKCTIWMQEKGRCVGGDATGPTYKTENGTTLDIDNYYYMNKCYGKNCT